MRPLELYLDGFKSYGEPTTFDFEGRGLFGIVGPTGSGKSSILDAMIFGLYGKTLRLQKETKRLINSQAEEAKVRLSFEADGGLWQVDRAIRRTGPSAVVLIRLDRPIDPVTGDRNVNEKVGEILGLDFDAFCSSVSLPQGEFDRFLNATKSMRSEILKGLFRLDKVDRLRDAAKSRAAQLQGKMQVFRLDIAAVPEDAEATVAAHRANLAFASERLQEMEAVLPEVTAAEKVLDRVQHALETLEERSAQTRVVLAGLPDADRLGEVEAQEESAKRRLKEASELADRASKLLEAANRSLADSEQAGRSEKWCADLEARLVERLRLTAEISAAAEEVAEAGREIDGLRPVHLAAEDEARRAEKALRDARRNLEDLRDRHAAHHLRSALKTGEACPVCEQAVALVPASSPPPAVKAAELAVTAAEQELGKRRKDAQRSGQLFAVAEDRKAGGARRLKARRAALETAEQAVAALTGAGIDAAAELESARAALSAAKRQADEQMAEFRRATAVQVQVRGELEALSSARAKVAGQLVYLAGVLDVDKSLIEFETLVAVAKRINEAGQLRLEALADERRKLKDAAEESAATVTRFGERFDASAGQTPSDIVTSTRGKIDDLLRRIEAVEQILARKAQAENQIAGLEVEKALFDRLISDMTDSKFTAYLLDEQRRLLARVASDKLLELTGRYVFDDDGDFNVIDQATGSTRTPDTLSGGETFLASLSMALALAEAVALQGGQLGCFFLDEGFGSLDAESLDLALEGIEALAVPGRLIGLISHVGGIQARLDDLIVLEKKTDGTSTVCQDGGPITFSPAAI